MRTRRTGRVSLTTDARGVAVAALTAAALCLGGCVFDKEGHPSPDVDAGPTACGNGVLDDGEACDDQNQQNGDGCNGTCQVEPGWQCNDEPSVCVFLCGNGILDPGELCDGANLGGATCATIPGEYTGGTLACGGSCQYDTTACILPGCGNGEVGPGEACDDGNTSNEDGCLNNCQLASCGDGYVWTGQEACDDGNALDTDDCLSDCTAASCGDGFIWAAQEDCDDGNAVDTDDCLSDCSTASCGDGFIWAAQEDCDDGNALDTDDCLSDCTEASCGDGFIWAGQEDCDDQNTSDNDACLSDCSAASCGDGFIWAGQEDCDDGDGSSGDGCSSTCTVEPNYGCNGEPSDCGCVVYVNQATPATSPTGASWLTAHSDLAVAINQARSSASAAGNYCDVWVAQGTYATSTTYMLPTRVVVYGGFAGGETARSQRDIAANVTILDGLGSANSVVGGVDISESGLDGLVVRNGLGNGFGGGVWLSGQSLSLANCVIEDNHATTDSGGVHLTTDSTVTINRCVIRNNSAGDDGGGLLVRDGATVVVWDSLFYGNTTSDDGGSIRADNATTSLTLINCTIVSSTAANLGGGIYNNGATLTVTNSILWGNSSEIDTNGGSTTVTYSSVVGGYAGAGNTSTNPLFVSPGGHIYQLQATSPCVDSANGDAASGRDILGRGRVDAPLANTGIGTPDYVDRGAFEYQIP